MTATDFWTAESVRAAMGGSWVVRPDESLTLAGGAAIDTRALHTGEVFFALRGDHTDGHRFVCRAAEAGAGLAVIDDVEAAGELPEQLAVLRVPDARAALGRLALSYRATLGPVRVIAVTGSNGKTTTTRMIDACLRISLRGHSSPKSYNNDLGVPLTILGAPAGTQYLLCEVGSNEPGEIEPLSRIIRPHVVVITSIGRAHMEGFGSLDAVAAEKSSLATHVEPGGVVVCTGDSPSLSPWVSRFERVFTFGVSHAADMRVGSIEPGADGLSFVLNGRDVFTVPMVGEHNAMNATAAITVARRLGIDDDTIRAALAGFAPPAMRLARVRVAGVEVINDAYNANPESMLAALRTLRNVAAAGSRRVAVLGDMLEMGDAGPDAHREIGDVLARERLADMAILVGPLAGLAEEALRVAGVNAVTIPDVGDDGAARVASLLEPGDTVLLKGSRGVGLERVLDAMGGAKLPSPSPGGVG
jgi:UDP-N-acetylmuramoyl-tripeptide--D-alanyl-D-alanine ligase